MGTVLKLQQAKQFEATNEDLLSWQAQLRAACINSISPDDMQQIVAKQLEKAKEGDAKAVDFVMQLIGSKQNVTINNTFASVEHGANHRRTR